MALILHITQRSAWKAAMQAGSYPVPPLAVQGFIHCSRPDQVIGVADYIFRGQQDLVLLCIATDRLTAPLDPKGLEKGDEEFPHIHGQLNLNAVAEVMDFPPNEDGTFALPAALSKLDDRRDLEAQS